jgi:hypothetical protein
VATTSLYFVSGVSGNVSSPNNALGAPDGTWTTDGNAVTNWTHRWSLDTVTGFVGGTQTLTLRLRKGSNSGTPTISSVTLFQDDISLGALTLSSGSTDITSTTGQDLVYTFSSLMELDAMGILAMNGALAMQGNSLHTTANTLKSAIDTAQNKAEFDAVVWVEIESD